MTKASLSWQSLYTMIKEFDDVGVAPARKNISWLLNRQAEPKILD
jgi:hypothetical protein